jgi:hypothetical protein
MLERFARGREVLNAAAEAMGGAQVVRGIAALSFTARGDTYNDVQGFHASNIGRPERDGRLTVINNFDFTNARFSQRTQQELAGGFALDSSAVYRDGTLYSLRNNGEEYLQTLTSPNRCWRPRRDRRALESAAARAARAPKPTFGDLGRRERRCRRASGRDRILVR